MRTPLKITTALFAFLAAVSAVGVSASFFYADADPEAQAQTVGVNVALFDWEGAEELPDDVTGENHQVLIDLILNSDAGLNTENSYLNQQIQDRKDSYWSWDTYGSMDVYDATQMASIFQTETNGLTFLLEFPDNEPNTQYIYTTSVELGESAILSQNNNIPTDRYVYAVYRTIATKDAETGKWIAQKSELGYARSDWYDNNALGSWVAKCPSFDPDSWTAGKQGTNRSNSIYAYVGMTATAYVDSDAEIIYYDLTNSSRGTRAITTYNPDVDVVVTNTSGKEVTLTKSTLQDADGKTYYSYSWTASANTKYYIQLLGDTSMTFTIA